MSLSVAVIRLLSFGFLHPGRERFKRVTKECWRIIPGSTLYGAVAAALIRTDCKKGQASFENCLNCVDQKNPFKCGYAELLIRGKEKDNMWRFSPLVCLKDSQREKQAYDLLQYCIDADGSRPQMAVVPRAPRSRTTGSISGSRLHGIVAHMPFQEYWGYVLAPQPFIQDKLNKALFALQLFPFAGGRGKFTQVSAELIHVTDVENFARRIDSLNNPILKLLTPAIVDSTPLDRIAGIDDFLISGFRPRLYSSWRTGFYTENKEPKFYPNQFNKNETSPCLGLSPGLSISFKKPLDQAEQKTELKNLLIKGFGQADYVRLGWGQMIIKEKQDESNAAAR
jgi:hypothetical protein